MKKNEQSVHCPAPRPVPPPAKWNPAHVGVTTSETSTYERACMDRILAQQFNPEYIKHGEKAPHLYEAYGNNPSSFAPPQAFSKMRNTQERFSHRTEFDKDMLTKFDPQYRKDKMVREAYQPNHSLVSDDPYAPYSYAVTYPNMI